MRSSKGWLELGFIYQLRAKQKKRHFGHLGSIGSGKVHGKSMGNKGCLAKFVMQI